MLMDYPKHAIHNTQNAIRTKLALSPADENAVSRRFSWNLLDFWG